jgi:hypothetical protein
MRREAALLTRGLLLAGAGRAEGPAGVDGDAVEAARCPKDV